MSTNFPTSLDSYTTHSTGDVINPSDVNNPQDAIVALETKVGVDSSAVTTTLDYKLKSTSSSDPGHKHTLASLSDFNVSAPATNNLLVYTNGKWTNTANTSVSFKFGGTGADGTLNISSGTTNIDLGNAAVVIKNYTSISITGTAALTFTNPNTNGTIVMFKSQGAVTITTSATRAIDARLIGGQAGSDGYGAPAIYKAGTAAIINNATGQAGGVAGVKLSGRLGKSIFLAVGGGGGNGVGDVSNGLPKPGGAGGGSGASADGTAGSAGSGNSASTPSTGGTGGRGGGCIYIECGGALNITGTIDVSGENGTAASGGDCGSGGGGAGGGMVCIIYNTLTANSGTYTVTAGTHGASVSTAGTSGDGGAGISLVAANTEFI